MGALDSQASSLRVGGSGPNARCGNGVRTVPLEGDWRQQADASFQRSRSCPAVNPSPEEVAAVLSALAEQLALALDGVTEEAMSDKVEVALQDICKTLALLQSSLPETKEGAASMLEAFGAPRPHVAWHLHSAAQGHPFGTSPERPLTPEEFQKLMRALKTVLGEVRVALADVSRDEIEELVDVAFTAARMGLSASQAAARKLRDAAAKNEFRNRVIIEDLEESDDSSEKNSPSSNEGIVDTPRIVFLQSRRYLWRPLWPQLRAWMARPSIPPATRDVAAALFHKSRQRPAAALVVGTMASPVAICGATATAVALPWVLIGDLVLQQLYIAKKQSVDDIVESSLQITRLAYLSTRLTGRRAFRFARTQAKRALRGRTPGQVAMDVLRDPVGSTSTAVSYAGWAAEETWCFTKAAWRAAPDWGQRVSDLWQKYQDGNLAGM